MGRGAFLELLWMGVCWGAFLELLWMGVTVQSTFMGGCTYLEYIYGWVWVGVTV